MKDFPKCCDQEMLVKANRMFECDVCGEEMSLSDYENRGERDWERRQEAARDGETLQAQYEAAWAEHRELHR